MKEAEEIACEPLETKIKGFSYKVKVGGKVVALTSEKNFGDVLVLTLTRMLWIKSLDQKVMLNLVLDFVTMLATDYSYAAKKVVKTSTKKKSQS